MCYICVGWLGSRVVSVLDSSAEGPGFKSQPRRCRVTVSGKLFTRHGTGSFGHRVNGSFGSSFTSGSPGHFYPVWDPSFPGFRKKCPKCKMSIWNAEITKVIVSCLLLDWNHWMSVHAMNFYIYPWLLKILWPENTFSHLSRHLEFIIEQGHQVNWVSGSLDSRVTGSLGHKMWPSSISAVHTLCASVHQTAKLVAALLRVAGETAGLAESNGSLPLGLWLTSPAGWLPRTGISSEPCDRQSSTGYVYLLT